MVRPTVEIDGMTLGEIRKVKKDGYARLTSSQQEYWDSTREAKAEASMRSRMKNNVPSAVQKKAPVKQKASAPKKAPVQKAITPELVVPPSPLPDFSEEEIAALESTPKKKTPAKQKAPKVVTPKDMAKIQEKMNDLLKQAFMADPKSIRIIAEAPDREDDGISNRQQAIFSYKK